MIQSLPRGSINNPSGIAISCSIEPTGLVIYEGEEPFVQFLETVRGQAIKGRPALLTITEICRSEARHRLGKNIRYLNLANGFKGLECFRRQHASAVEEELIEASIAQLRLAKVRRVEKSGVPLDLAECRQKYFWTAVDVHRIPNRLDNAPIPFFDVHWLRV